MDHDEEWRTSVEAVAALDDLQRSRLYDVVRRARKPVTREDAAQAVGISRKLAAFHLDRLVAVGLLAVAAHSDVLPRRVGRAPKFYVPAERAVHVSIPPRAHDELAAILVDAAVSARSGETPERTRRRLARKRGRQSAQAVDRKRSKGRLGVERALTLAESALDTQGYEPYRVSPACIRLRNCPFHPLAERAPELVCGVNEAFLGGYLEGLGADSLTAILAPQPGECCVEVRRRT